MSNITFQIIPFAFIFVLSYFSCKEKNTKRILIHKEIHRQTMEHKEFFENAEKIIALRELYRQELIDIICM